MKYRFNRDLFFKTRDELIVHFCKGKDVLHLGATDSPYTSHKLKEGLLLHQKICKVAKKVVGVDIDADAIEYLKGKGFNNILFHDLNKIDSLEYFPEIIIFGETIEHIMNLEHLFSHLKKIMNQETRLIISTPNALYINNIFNVLFYKECLHHDHKLSFTYGTLSNLLEANDFIIEKRYFTFLNRSKTSLMKFFFILFSKVFVGSSETLLFISRKRNFNYNKL